MTLRRRLTLAFVLCALLAAACFSALGMMFVYMVEDRFLDRMLEQETRGIATPLRPHLQFYRDLSQFPPDLARQSGGVARPGEFFGAAGRHYHVRKVDAGYMVAEVSSQLVVRPWIPAIAGMLAAMAALLLLLIGGAGYLFARRVTAPVERLAGLLERSDGGSLPRGFAQSMGQDEIGTLARSLDAALERIAAFVTREQQFTRDASHELRTPLAVIDGAAALMEGESLSPEGRAQLRRIRDACALMQRTTDTLLAVSREGRMATAASLPLLPLVEATVVRHAHLLDGKPVEVVVEVAPQACMAVGQGVMEILLANLIGNAFSHTESGRVIVRMDGADLVVENAGELARPEASRGYGLGLSIAQRLAQQYGVALAVSSHADTVSARLRTLPAQA